MEELIGVVAAVWPLLLTITVLIVSIWASQQVNPMRDFDISQRANRCEAARHEEATRAFTERIDRETAKREEQFEWERVAHEAGTQALIVRSDRRFEALLVRSGELARQLAEVVARAAHNDTRVRVMEAARSRTEADPSAPAPGGTEAVAAQAVPRERRPK